jgi:DNA-directed RNA polymerase specialized sigma24 family protein
MRAQQAEPAPNITPKMVDWILYNMPVLRDQVDAIEPRLSTSLVVLSRQSTRGPSSGVERVAIKRAAVSSVLDAAQRGIRSLHPEQRKVYRMRYRAGMSYKQIARRLYISEETVGRRLAEVRAMVGQYLQQVSPSDLAEFARFFDSRS